MRAKPTGRPPSREKARAPRPRAIKVKIPRDLTPAQRRHLREIATGATNQSLVDEYAQALQLRDECATAIKKEGAMVKTERGARKMHPCAQLLTACNNQMLRLRGLIARAAKEEQPATAPAGSASDYEQNVQRVLRGEFDDDPMELLIDNAAGDRPWIDDRRVQEYVQEYCSNRNRRTP